MSVDRKSVLLVDDHPIVRAGCQQLLAGHRVIEAETGAQALALYRADPSDIVVLDLGLPDLGGLVVTKQLRDEDPQARILVFSMYEDPVFAAQSLALGAMGYITKNDGPEELTVAVDTVLAGEVYLSHDMARELAVMNFSPQRSPLQSLTARELETLSQLGRGRSIGDIAEHLRISYKTVANTCTQLKEKLGVSSTRELIRIAVEQRLGS